MLEDERLTQIETEKQEALTENEALYNEMVTDADKYYQNQIDAVDKWTSEQSELQQQMTDFTIEQIEQQKEQEAKDYTKEQSGAYVDWQKENNKYGVNAEQMAAGGLTNTGYSESSQVGMYNAYQNRVATARESYRLAVQNYNNAIKDAQLQNSSALAEIAYNGLQQQLALSLEGLQYKNDLLQTQANQALAIENMYHGHYIDMLNQINEEKAQAEQIRQFNKKMEEDKRQFDVQQKQQKAIADAQSAQLKSIADAQSEAMAQLDKGKQQFDDNYAGKYLQNSAVAKYKNIADNFANQHVKLETNPFSQSLTNNSISTYSDAVKYLRMMGVASGDGGLMTESEWKSRKIAGSTSEVISEFDTYEDYIKHFIVYRLANPQR